MVLSMLEESTAYFDSLYDPNAYKYMTLREASDAVIHAQYEGQLMMAELENGIIAEQYSRLYYGGREALNEGIGDTIKNVIDKVIEFVKKVGAAIRDFFKKIIDWIKDLFGKGGGGGSSSKDKEEKKKQDQELVESPAGDTKVTINTNPGIYTQDPFKVLEDGKDLLEMVSDHADRIISHAQSVFTSAKKSTPSELNLALDKLAKKVGVKRFGTSKEEPMVKLIIGVLQEHLASIGGVFAPSARKQITTMADLYASIKNDISFKDKDQVSKFTLRQLYQIQQANLNASAAQLAQFQGKYDQASKKLVADLEKYKKDYQSLLGSAQMGPGVADTVPTYYGTRIDPENNEADKAAVENHKKMVIKVNNSVTFVSTVINNFTTFLSTVSKDIADVIRAMAIQYEKDFNEAKAQAKEKHGGAVQRNKDRYKEKPDAQDSSEW